MPPPSAAACAPTLRDLRKESGVGLVELLTVVAVVAISAGEGDLVSNS